MQQQSGSVEMTVWTIGHSNHSLERFLELLDQHRIAVLVDVRSSPYSRYASHFNREAIRGPLEARGIEYQFLGDLLGGRVEDERFYDGQGHVLYDRLARCPPFLRGIERVLDELGTRRVALMCGEEDPAGCHRRLLVGRVLGQRGATVMHLRGDGRVQTEEEVAAEEKYRKTKGQLTLFDMEETDEWRSSQSVLPRKARPSSSKSSSEEGSGG